MDVENLKAELQEKIPAEKKLEEERNAPEVFAGQKIQAIEKDIAIFKHNANSQVLEAEQSIGLGREGVREARSALGLDEKNSKIVGEANNLAEGIKTKIKKIVAIGMATVAFSGAGNFEKTRGGSNENDEISFNLAKKNESNQKDIFVEEDPIANAEKQSKIAELRESAEKMKNASMQHIASAEYLRRLTNELGGYSDGAKELQKRRLENLANVTFEFLTKDEMKKRFGADDPVRSYVVGVYNSVENKIFITCNLKNRKDIDETIEHELQHASVGNDKYMTKRAKEFFTTFHDGVKTKNPDLDKYLGDYREKMAWKMETDIELEKLGIKKYDEVFTKEHYKILRDKCDKGELPSHLKRLVEKMREVDFIEMFNEIAENEKMKNDFTEQA